MTDGVVVDGRTRRADVLELFDEYFASLRSHGEELRRVLAHQNPAAELADLDSFYAPPHGRMLVAVLDGRAVGCVAVKRLDERTGEIKRLYVRPAGRGRGIGSLLVERVLDEARSLGYRRVVLDTMAHMTSAIGLYERHGFRRIAAYNDAPSDNVVFLARPL